MSDRYRLPLDGGFRNTLREYLVRVIILMAVGALAFVLAGLAAIVQSFLGPAQSVYEAIMRLVAACAVLVLIIVFLHRAWLSKRGSQQELSAWKSDSYRRGQRESSRDKPQASNLMRSSPGLPAHVQLKAPGRVVGSLPLRLPLISAAYYLYRSYVDPQQSLINASTVSRQTTYATRRDRPTPHTSTLLWPLLLLLDTSASMQGRPIEELNNELEFFGSSIRSSNRPATVPDIAILTFGENVRLVQDFASPSTFRPPRLDAGGPSPAGAAINEALKILESRIDAYRHRSQAHIRPWLVLVTDSEPTDDWVSASMRLSEAVESRWTYFMLFDIGGRAKRFSAKMASDKAVVETVDNSAEALRLLRFAYVGLESYDGRSD